MKKHDADGAGGWLRRTVRDLARGIDAPVAVVLVTSGLVLFFLHYFVNKPTFEIRPIPTRKLVRWSILCFAAYFVVPAVMTLVVLKKRLRDFGLTLAGIRKHLPLYALLYLGVFPLVWLASRDPAFLDTYPFSGDARYGWQPFLIWQALYFLQFFSLEFFFRGFMIFGLEKRLGVNAVFVMAVPYCMIHFAKPAPEALGALGAGVILGILALRTRSIFGGVLIHCAVAFTMDFLAIQAMGGFP